MKLIPAALLVLALPAAAQEANWPTFRGAARDGHSPDTGLLKRWPAGGPKLAWKAKGLGTGYASVAVWGDKLYTLGDAPDCFLICLSAADGKELWRLKLGGAYTKWSGNRDFWGYNRATPTTDGKIVIGLAPTGELVCADAATGKEIWRKHAKSDFGGDVGNWDYSESPLIDGDQVAFVPGGSKGAVVALNKATGAPVWTCKEFTDKAEYASLLPVEIGGVRQYLAYTQQSVAGIAAKNGKLLWKAARPGKTAVIPTPVYKDGIVFVASGYGVGHNAFKVEGSGGSFSASEIYKGEDMINHHGGVILVKDHVYGISDKGGLKCIELKTGKVAWEQKGVAKGAIVYADGLLVCRAEDKGKGTVVLCAADPTAYQELGRFDQPELSGKPTWAHPVVVGGKLYLRDQDALLVYDVKGK